MASYKLLNKGGGLIIRILNGTNSYLGIVKVLSSNNQILFTHDFGNYDQSAEIKVPYSEIPSLTSIVVVVDEEGENHRREFSLAANLPESNGLLMDSGGWIYLNVYVLW